MHNIENKYNYTPETSNSIGAGRYHPDWQLRDWQWKFWRSPDLKMIASSLEDRSVKQDTLHDINTGSLQSEQHPFTIWHESREYVMIQKLPHKKDLFWFFDLRVMRVIDELNVDIEVCQVREVLDTTEGMVFGANIVPSGSGGVIALGGDVPHTNRDWRIIEYGSDFLPKKFAVPIFLAVQNWVFRSIN